MAVPATAVAPVCSFAASAQQPPAAQSTLDVVKQRGTVIVGMQNDYPPFSFIDGQGNWAGFEVELVQYIAHEIGVKMLVQAVSGAARVPLLVSGNVDFVATPMLPTPDRAKIIDFIIPFYYDRNAILAKKESNIRSLSDLQAPRKIGLAAGGYTGSATLKIEPKAQLVSFQEWPGAVQALLSGHVDAVVSGQTALEEFLKRSPNADLVITPEPRFKDDPCVMSVRRNDSRWRQFLDTMVMQAWADGTIPRLHEKYLGRAPDYDVQPWPTIDDAKKPGFWAEK